MLEIKGIYLLSDAQYEGEKHLIPPIDKDWWLQTSGCTSCVKIIKRDGSESYSAHFNLDMFVRPALILNNIMPVGGVFEFAGVGWTVVSCISKTSIAICNTVIAQRRFDAKSNEWDKSELKVWLEEWVEYICLGSDDVVYDPVYHY